MSQNQYEDDDEYQQDESEYEDDSEELSDSDSEDEEVILARLRARKKRALDTALGCDDVMDNVQFIPVTQPNEVLTYVSPRSSRSVATDISTSNVRDNTEVSHVVPTYNSEEVVDETDENIHHELSRGSDRHVQEVDHEIHDEVITTYSSSDKHDGENNYSVARNKDDGAEKYEAETTNINHKIEAIVDVNSIDDSKIYHDGGISYLPDQFLRDEDNSIYDQNNDKDFFDGMIEEEETGRDMQAAVCNLSPKTNGGNELARDDVTMENTGQEEHNSAQESFLLDQCHEGKTLGMNYCSKMNNLDYDHIEEPFEKVMNLDGDSTVCTGSNDNDKRVFEGRVNDLAAHQENISTETEGFLKNDSSECYEFETKSTQGNEVICDDTFPEPNENNAANFDTKLSLVSSDACLDESKMNENFVEHSGVKERTIEGANILSNVKQLLQEQQFDDGSVELHHHGEFESEFNDKMATDDNNQKVVDKDITSSLTHENDTAHANPDFTTDNGPLSNINKTFQGDLQTNLEKEILHVVDDCNPDTKLSSINDDNTEEVFKNQAADIEMLRKKIELTNNTNKELLDKIEVLQQKITVHQSEAADVKRQHKAEMKENTTRHIAIVKALREDHHNKVQEYERKITELSEHEENLRQDIAELSVKLSDSDCSYVNLDAHVKREPERQQEAVRVALEKAFLDLKEMKRQQPSTGSQTDPDAVVEEYLAHISALTESNDSLKDDVDGLNYKVEELEVELVNLQSDYSAAKCKFRNAESAVASYDDKANLLQMKLQAANDEVERSNKDYQDILIKYNVAEKELKNSAQLVQDLYARAEEMDKEKETLESRISDSMYENELLREEIDSLRQGKNIAMYGCNSTGGESTVHVMRATVDNEHGDTTNDIVDDFGTTNFSHKDKKDGMAKSTKKQRVSERFKKQVSASAPMLPSLTKNSSPTKKKKTKRIKLKTTRNSDDQSTLLSVKAKKKTNKCHECACRIKGEPKILPCELKTNICPHVEDDDYSCNATDNVSSILDHQYMFRDKYGHRRGEEAIFCSWTCAREWNSKHTPIQHRRTTRQLINIADGYGKGL